MLGGSGHNVKEVFVSKLGQTPSIDWERPHSKGSRVSKRLGEGLCGAGCKSFQDHAADGMVETSIEGQKGGGDDGTEEVDREQDEEAVAASIAWRFIVIKESLDGGECG